MYDAIVRLLLLALVATLITTAPQDIAEAQASGFHQQPEQHHYELPGVERICGQDRFTSAIEFAALTYQGPSIDRTDCLDPRSGVGDTDIAGSTRPSVVSVF